MIPFIFLLILVLAALIVPIVLTGDVVVGMITCLCVCIGIFFYFLISKKGA